MTRTDLSIIIVSFNTRDILRDCILSVIKHTKGIVFEIIVIDNQSSDGSLEMIRDLAKKHPEIRAIDAKGNLGFGKANNLGAKHAKGEYLLLLNSDTYVYDNAIAESLAKAKDLPLQGVFSCRLLNKDRSVQASGGSFPTLVNIFAWQFFIDDLPLIGSQIPSFHPQISTYKSNKTVDWVTGAFMIVRKDIFDQVGGFDEKIFMYTEEMELCFRLSHLGFKAHYHTSPSIVHLGGASSNSAFAITNEVKNMIYFFRKHKPRWQVPLVQSLFFIGSLLRLLLFGIIKGDAKAKSAYSQALRLIF